MELAKLVNELGLKSLRRLEEVAPLELEFLVRVWALHAGLPH
jgi:hypothetical protein